MRKLIVLSAALAAVMPAALSDAASTVSVKDDLFSPKSISVSKGSTVTWVWKGKHAHNVTSSGFHSKTMKKGSYSHKVSKTVKVFCTIHSGMAMTVKVK